MAALTCREIDVGSNLARQLPLFNWRAADRAVAKVSNWPRAATLQSKFSHPRYNPPRTAAQALHR